MRRRQWGHPDSHQEVFIQLDGLRTSEVLIVNKRCDTHQLKQQLAQSLGTRSRPPQTESGNRRLQSFEVPRHMLPSSPMVPPRNPSAGAPMLNTSSSDVAPRGFSSAGRASQAEGAVQTRSQTAVASERNAAETFLTAHAMLNPVARNLIDRTTTARYMETRAAFIEANGWSPLLGQL